MALALLLSWLLTGFWIAGMKALGLGKRVRRDGPETHLKKEGTPSMGGVAFLLAGFLAYLLLGGGCLQGALAPRPRVRAPGASGRPLGELRQAP